MILQVLHKLSLPHPAVYDHVVIFHIKLVLSWTCPPLQEEQVYCYGSDKLFVSTTNLFYPNYIGILQKYLTNK